MRCAAGAGLDGFLLGMLIVLDALIDNARIITTREHLLVRLLVRRQAGARRKAHDARGARVRDADVRVEAARVTKTQSLPYPQHSHCY